MHSLNCFLYGNLSFLLDFVRGKYDFCLILLAQKIGQKFNLDLLTMQPSIYQQKVIDWLGDNRDLTDSVVNSVAGSGKSTLLKLAADAISGSSIDIKDCLVLVFNRKNKDALIAKLDPRWSRSISTVHSAGYRVLKRYLGVRKLDVIEHKYRNLARYIDWFDGSNPEQGKLISRTSFLRLADFVRQTLSGTTPEALRWLIDRYALDIQSKDLIAIGERLQMLFEMGSQQAAESAIVDHTDMLWLPIVWQIDRSPGFKYALRVMVDEAQDMSRLQLEFVLSLAHKEAKMLFVGDPAQSINGFCGADTNSFNNIKQRLNANEFTLPICYRCPVSHIELINQLCPDIPIKPKNNAPQGIIKVISESDLWHQDSDTQVRARDLVIARCSSSLVDLNLKLITRGIACNLVGSSLKRDLLELLEDISSQSDFIYHSFLKFCQAYLELKRSIYQENDNGSVLLMQLQDRVKAIKAIYQHFHQCQSVENLTEKIEQLFSSEDSESVLLSTIHRAKGMEAERVYLAEPLTLPLIWDNQKPWQQKQEQNLLYVALSRSTKDLFLIGDAFWFDGNPKQARYGSSTSKFAEEANNTDKDLIVSTASTEELIERQKLIQLELGKRAASRLGDLINLDLFHDI